jgi:hypothetical protein
MRVVCDRDCQIRIRGKIHTITAGDIMTLDVDECPEHFHELGKLKAEENESDDFENITDAELREMEGNVGALKDFLELNYPEITFASNIGWPKLVERYIEARDNRVSKVDNTGKQKSTIVSVRRQLDAESDSDEEKDSDGDGIADNVEDALDDIDDLLKGD